MDIIEVNTSSHYEAGRQVGVKTKEIQRMFYAKLVPEFPWDVMVAQSAPFLEVTERVFPHFVSELRGLAEGIDVPFERVWAIQCRDEIVGHHQNERCSSVFVRSDRGWMVGHNEDDFWSGFSKEEARKLYFLVRKTIAGNSIFYLGFPFMIGGETISIHASGTVQTINTLHHKNVQVGVPRNIIARALCEVDSLEKAQDILAKTKRASGYCHTLLIDGTLSCIESTESSFELIPTADKFVHTNHYLGSLVGSEEYEEEGYEITTKRCAAIGQKIETVETGEDLKTLLHTKSDSEYSIYRDGEFSITMVSVVYDSSKGVLSVANRNNGDRMDWEDIIPFPKGA